MDYLSNYHRFWGSQHHIFPVLRSFVSKNDEKSLFSGDKNSRNWKIRCEIFLLYYLSSPVVSILSNMDHDEPKTPKKWFREDLKQELGLILKIRSHDKILCVFHIKNIFLTGNGSKWRFFGPTFILWLTFHNTWLFTFQKIIVYVYVYVCTIGFV